MRKLTSSVGQSLPAMSRIEIESQEARAARQERMAFYSSRRWREVARRQLADEPLCCWCGRLADMVDHVTPRLQRPDLAYARDNLRSCCRACHAIHGVKSPTPGGGV